MPAVAPQLVNTLEVKRWYTLILIISLWLALQGLALQCFSSISMQEIQGLSNNITSCFTRCQLVMFWLLTEGKHTSYIYIFVALFFSSVELFVHVFNFFMCAPCCISFLCYLLKGGPNRHDGRASRSQGLDHRRSGNLLGAAAPWERPEQYFARAEEALGGTVIVNIITIITFIIVSP